jgi:chemotaxis regulatin CheY-phosphate phosphatase CheZ
MSRDIPHEALYDTAATLRLVDAELGALAGRIPPAPVAAPVAAPAPAAAATPSFPIPGEGRVLAKLPNLLEQAMHEVTQMLFSLREGRENIRQATMERLSSTHAKLDEVKGATATAATDILDALDRSTALVDDLDAIEASGDHARGTDVRNQLRDELFTVMGHMQFQDITSQQILSAQSLLGDMEARLVQIAELFDLEVGQRRDHAGSPNIHVDPRRFDPNATLDDADSRQALADALVRRATG